MQLLAQRVDLVARVIRLCIFWGLTNARHARQPLNRRRIHGGLQPAKNARVLLKRKVLLLMLQEIV